MSTDSRNRQIDYDALPHILVVDDDDRIRALVTRYLNENGFLALSVENAAQAKEALGAFAFDAAVLDVMMPGQTGVELTGELRGGGNDLPVILLTAMGEIDDKIGGLQSGADDYLTKPFDPRELVMRLQTILRRRPAVRAEEGDVPLQIGDMRFDPALNALHSGGGIVKLTDVEANLLKALGRRANEILSRETLAELCGLDAGERTIDVQVTRLRKKLGEDSKMPYYLQTVRGKGYILRAERIGG